MMRTRKRQIAVLLAMSMGVGCSDLAPLAPTPDSGVGTAAEVSRARQPTNDEQTIATLERLRPLKTSDSRTVIIGPAGGDIMLPRAGFRIHIPPGALTASTAISVTAHPGRAVAYEFGPHGLQFLVPVQIHQDLEGTTAEKSPELRQSLAAGYFENGAASIDDAAGVAVITERLRTTLSEKDMAVFFEITHFSGYILATG